MDHPLGNAMNGAEAMVRMLEAHGVKHIFGESRKSVAFGGQNVRNRF